ncbi:probable F420-dependent oxidoreductase, Rv3520c family [Pseudonocardia ammonioxydans]|uniref:Probable F420-dependent oxidoreductase, Rv3520c family n=1 Tax=Pseudonocardia ammonioxydans TaxID=260086 RepID=A0A1I4RTT5_PSUAM|nr:LLM class F420-dependent oxidoreductase [Pseudonocardia ammonioxydans]SFM55628.1 probable F420-dependent oxidoreductase, Rv3520c family [Pseudonocardia ammonioxydans]
MKLGLALGYWGSGPPRGIAEKIAAAEDLGFDSMWTAEAYGSDAFTPLSWLGARTSRMRLGTSVVQMSARTPTATAMAAMTLDHLSGGRMVLGIGASGPQVVEGWYGQPYPRPLARTREYVRILRDTIAREKVTSPGPAYPIPHPGGTGLGKPLRSTLHPYRTDLPILLAAEGPRNVALAAEIADGWQPLFYAPRNDAQHRSSLAAGFEERGGRPDGFDVVCMVQVVFDDDVEAAADRVRPFLALYIGGMGARGANFHYEAFARMGYEDECARIQELYLGGDKAAAMRAVPTSMVEQVALVGPRAKIAEELPVFRDSLIGTMVVDGSPDELRTLRDLVG